MTSTQTCSVTAKQARADWLDGITASLIDDMDPLLWAGVVLVMLKEGPDLAAPTNMWWARRLRWLRTRVELRHVPRVIVIEALRDMRFANDNDGR
jgi:hypothetical protein